jgi:Dolichyl-phosphate-mannose-protein mannosyltransferase
MSWRSEGAAGALPRLFQGVLAEMEVLIPIFVFVPIGILIIIATTKSYLPQERSWLVTLLVVALLLRVGASTSFVAFPGLRIFHQDAQSYENIGMLIASEWRGEAPPGFQIPTVNWGFYQLSALIYYVFGRYRANVSLFNSLLGTMLTLLVYDLTKRLFHDIVARRAALLVALMPSMILWGSMALKDVPITFCLVVSLSSCVALKQKFTLTALAGMLLPIVAIYPLRFYIVYFLVFAIVLSLFLDRGLTQLTGVYRQLFLMGVIAALFVLLGASDQAESDAARYASLDYVSRYRRGMAVSANSGFDADVDISSPDAALTYLPIGMAHLLLAPFPWQWVSLGPLVAAPETVFWWTLVPATVRGMIFSLRNRFSETSPVLVFTATLTAVYSLMQGNVGAAFRQRAQILVFLFIFSAIGTSLAKARAVGVEPRRLLRNPEPEANPVT